MLQASTVTMPGCSRGRAQQLVGRPRLRALHREAWFCFYGPAMAIKQ